jgi:hypothetical protein
MEYNISLPPIDDARDITQRYLQEHASDLPLLSTQVVTYTNPTKVILYRYDLIRNNSNTPDYNRIYFGTFVSLAPANEILLTTQIIDPSGSIQPIDTPLAASAQIKNGDYVYEIFNYINAVPAEECYFVGYEFTVGYPEAVNRLVEFYVIKSSVLNLEFDITTYLNADNDSALTVYWGDGNSDQLISTVGSIGGGILCSHTYAAPGAYMVSVYSNAFMKKFFATNAYAAQNIASMTIYENSLLEYIRVTDNELVLFDAGSLNNAQYIHFEKNNLTIQSVNEMLIHADSKGTYGGYFNTVSQTPPAPRQGAGVTAYNNLVARGWTVNTDV